MYLVPAQPVPEAETAGYSGVRITCKAVLPPGLKGLLVSVFEANGAQYVAAPPPPPPGQLEAIVLPWERFELGSWSRDPQEGLDPNRITRISVGVHGTAAGDGGPGSIEIRGIDLVP
jgi:hypothetical protein